VTEAIRESTVPPVDINEKRDLTSEQMEAGLQQASRIIREAAGFYFGGEIMPFAPEFKRLALNAIRIMREDYFDEAEYPDA
jgi:hypothetical protein